MVKVGDGVEEAPVDGSVEDVDGPVAIIVDGDDDAEDDEGAAAAVPVSGGVVLSVSPTAGTGSASPSS